MNKEYYMIEQIQKSIELEKKIDKLKKEIEVVDFNIRKFEDRGDTTSVLYWSPVLSELIDDLEHSKNLMDIVDHYICNN